tara:strand:+ start:2039 stop:2182 length:144 start_codon:yes stop_codon:yes gene_type:complete
MHQRASDLKDGLEGGLCCGSRTKRSKSMSNVEGAEALEVRKAQLTRT